MVQFSTTTAGASKGTWAQALRDLARHWLTGRRGLAVVSLAIIAAGLALGWGWLTAVGIAPIILSLAPCAAMCALGACAMMKGNAGGAKPDVVSAPLVLGEDSASRGSDIQSARAAIVKADH